MTENTLGTSNQQITLTNPVTKHFASFIFGNATKCDTVVEMDSAKGQTIVICGAGPTLRTSADKWCPKGDQVWGCNSALTWLAAHGHPVTHGFTVDQTAHMVLEWDSAPDVEYLVASTIHPHLTEHLMAKGRSLRWFHNYVGIDERPVSWADEDGVMRIANYEDWLYSAFYPATIRAGSGLNAVTRAIDVADFMGAKEIVVLGSDCCLQVNKPRPKGAEVGTPAHTAWLRAHTVMHADGGSALASEATAVTIEGTIDGRLWTTKPDMMITAVWLVHMKRKYGSRLRIIGDTLTKALLHKDDAFLSRLPTLVDARGEALTFENMG